MRRKDREVRDIKEICEILDSCRTCHVAMVDGDMPYVVPLSFGYIFTDSGALELYFHSAAEGRKIDILRRNNRVCFEISSEGEALKSETPCDAGYYFSSVIGFGEVLFIEDVVNKCEALSIMFKQQTGRDVVFDEGQATSVCVFKIVSADYAGKRKLKK